MKTRLNLLQLTVLFIMAMFAVVHAADVGKDDILAAARKWIADNAVFKAELPNAIPEKATQLADDDGKAMPLWRVDLKPTGYLVMSSDDTLPPVVTFNTKGPFEMPADHPLPSILKRQGSIFKTELGKPQTRGNGYAAENKARWNALLNRTRAKSVTPSEIITPPMLTTKWHQHDPYNYFCPSGNSYDEHAVVGCAPLAICQLLKYHEWPPAGVSLNPFENEDNKGDIQCIIHGDITFPYDWNMMKDRYDETAERSFGAAELAVARLAMEMGAFSIVGYELDGTAGGYGYFFERHHSYLRYSNSAKFGVVPPSISTHYTVDQTTLFSWILEDMKAMRPSLLTIATPGHAFVADGLATMGGQNYYHFNYGWGGDQDGWYLLTDGISNSVVDMAVTNIQPSPIAVFKPISCEQSSSFTLAWDFPKRLTAEAFRLMKTTGTGGYDVISSSISGTARSYTLTGQFGTATYTLEAKVDGSWQEASDGVTVTVKAVPTPMLELATDKILKCIAGTEVTTTVTANNSLESLVVTSSRPDILPSSGIVVSGNGASRHVKLTPVNDLFGCLLLYVTATDIAGNVVKQTIPMEVKEDAPLVWYTLKDEAMGAAMVSGNLVLLVTGYDDFYTSTFRNTTCEIGDIKAELLGNYTLWYCNSFQSSEHSPYTSGLGSASPWIAIINPANQSTRLRAHGGPITANETRQLLNCYMPYFSLDNDEIYVLGTTQTLELSDIRDDVVVYYRLDSATPTTSDTPYTEPLPLTETTTISARTFKNGEPVSDTVTKTYTFLEKVATPVLNKAENDYFFDSFVVTATCATPGATIRYTTDATIPTASSAVMPEGGLTVRTYSVVCVKAFKDGMADSDYIYTHLDIVRDLDGARNVVTGNVRVGTPSMSTAWYLQENTYNSAPTSLQSADIPADGSTVMVAKVTGAGALSFNWRTATDMLNEDHLFVSIDGVQQDVLYGGNGWSNRTFPITGDGDHYVRWAYAKTGSYSGSGGHAWVDDIIWMENTLESISIEGNGTIAVGGSEAYTCTAMWSNGTTSVVKPTWSVTPTTYASVDANGVVTNKNTTDKTVTLKATYTYNGVTKTASQTITLASRLISIAISGDATIASAGTATYTCTATWGDGTTTIITPTTWTVASASYASVDANGVVTNKNLTTADKTVTLKAVYTAAGVTQEATKTITAAKKTIMSVAITGDETIATGGSATYNCTVTWSYGPTSKALSPEWSLSSASYASVDANGVVTNENLTGRDLTVRLNVSCIVNGVTNTATKNITLSKKTIVSYVITGDASIPAGGTAAYRCTVKWSYGPDSTVPSPIWTLKSTPFATVDENGVVTNKNKTMDDQFVQLHALCTTDGGYKLVFKSIRVTGGATQTLALQPGWNWVSFYILPSNRTVGNVLGTAGFTANDIIQTNGDSARFTGSGWLPLSIEFGKLYQIYVDKAVTVEIPGAQSGQTTVPIQNGWNWIGNPAAKAIMLSDVSHSNGWTAGDRIQTAGGESAIHTADGNWVPADDLSLEPGKGYQIYASNAGTLSFTNQSLYVVVDLSGGPNASNYPVRYTNTAPDLNDDTCRTTELWLRRIPAGTFMMGSPEDEYGRSQNETQHEVTLTQDYYIGVFECTQKQWELVMGDRPSYFSNADYYATRPVEQVSYNMIRCTEEQDGVGWPEYGHAVGSRSFMGVLQAKTGLIFDLPTEAQWEYACRAGTTTALNSGMNLTSRQQDAAMDEVGRYYPNGGKETTQDCATDKGTAKVGSYLPNIWGLYDMHGNVCELCLDWYDKDYSGTAAVVDPLGPISGTSRVARNGCWANSAAICRAACRAGCSASISNSSKGCGFRVVCHQDKGKYAVVDLSGGPNAANYPVRYTDVAPDLNDDTCRTTELWLRKIPAGTFFMGSHAGEVGRIYSDEEGYQVTLTQDYYVGVFECTQYQWEMVMGDKPSYFSNEAYYATRPVENVSYDMIRGTSASAGAGWPLAGHAVDADSFMGKLRQKTGLTFDLPTEAQWEYACRAGTTTSLNSGKNLMSDSVDAGDAAVDEVGRYKFNGGGSIDDTSEDCTTANGTAKVGSYLSNAWGLYDMHGNLAEWCLDWHATRYDTTQDTDPVGPATGGMHMIRGGAWHGVAGGCRSASRNQHYSSVCSNTIGFRITIQPKQDLYAVVDLSGGARASSYPVRYTDVAPDLNDDTCRTTELWLRKIPAGTFTMGSPEDEVGHFGDESQHEVTLTQDFYAGVFECTQKQWELVAGSNPSENKGDCRPVENVSFDIIRGTSVTGGAGWPAYGHAVDADSFMGKLQAKTGLTFDLPTDAQWEYACRAGTTTALNSGKNLTSSDGTDDNLAEVGRYYGNRNDGKGNYSKHTKVGSYLPNAWGLYDMHGNVYEWCLDTPEIDLPSGSYFRNIRGGSWYVDPCECRSAARNNTMSSATDNAWGFRLFLLP